MHEDPTDALSRNTTRASRRIPSFKSYQRATPTQERPGSEDEGDHETPLLSNDKMEMPVPMVGSYDDENELR